MCVVCCFAKIMWVISRDLVANMTLITGYEALSLLVLFHHQACKTVTLCKSMDCRGTWEHATISLVAVAWRYAGGWSRWPEIIGTVRTKFKFNWNAGVLNVLYDKSMSLSHVGPTLLTVMWLHIRSTGPGPDPPSHLVKLPKQKNNNNNNSKHGALLLMSPTILQWLQQKYLSWISSIFRI